MYELPIGTECTDWNCVYQVCNEYLIRKYYIFEFETECNVYIIVKCYVYECETECIINI